MCPTWRSHDQAGLAHPVHADTSEEQMHGCHSLMQMRVRHLFLLHGGGSFQWLLQAELQECCAHVHVTCTGTHGDAQGRVGVRNKPAIRDLILCSNRSSAR